MKGSLEPEKIKRLEEIEFIWNIEEYNWEEGFSHLKEYKKEHGDCLAPHSIKFDGFALGNWVTRQRTKKGKLTPGKIQRLDDLSFVWSARALQWEQGFSELKAYKEKHGDCVVKGSFDTS
ncbi:MAG: hypothetical protein HOJ16_08610, partial [Candidatus Peribacter sp.]|nr:hypothetical protein [Candidatus Peribacter sp.]